MRLLVTIPHYFRPTTEGPGFYGSESGDAEGRRATVERCLAALHQTFGRQHALFGPGMRPCNAGLSMHIDVVVVTTGTQHLADALPRNLFTHYAAPVEPRFLGFVCHEFLREHGGRYDWYGFIEDDIEITDALYFHKLAWFNALFGPRVILQPNRFEIAHDLNVTKLYVDGETTRPEVSTRYQDITVRPILQAEAFGSHTTFRRLDNVHAGCFFLDAAQLAHIVKDPTFGIPTAEYFGPLESAVTLPIMRNFEAYKPALENAAFLEVRHLGRRFLRPTMPQPAAATPA